jgi:DNA-binding MarR family transcriptional regulator
VVVNRQGGRLDDSQIDAYLAIMEVAGQLQFRLERHLRSESDLSFVQFEILGKLMRAPHNRLRMTDLADGIVLSRSGLTYQVGRLESSGRVTRSASRRDDRSTIVDLTTVGEHLFLRLLPGHVEIVRTLLFDALPERDIEALGTAMGQIRDHIRDLPPRSAHRQVGRAASADS